MSAVAAIIPPQTGPRPDDYDDDRATGARIVVIVCCTLVAVIFLLRCVGRYALKLRNDNDYSSTRSWIGLDDVLNFVAVVTFFSLGVAVLIAIERGMGRHITRVIWDKGSEAVGDYQLAVYVCAITYNTTLGCVKLSVLALYRRILLGVRSKVLVILVWIVAGIVLANTIINVLVAAFQCSPVRLAFDTTLTGKCINQAAFYIGNAITGIITDLMVYALSIPIVKPLQMDVQRKWLTMATLLVGLFAVITSAIRLSFLPALLTNPDLSWAMAVPMDWSVVEPAVAIIASSAPAVVSIKYFWRHAFGGSATRSGTYKSQLESVNRTQRNVEMHGMSNKSEDAFDVKTKEAADDDSEKGLIYQGTDHGFIHKHTEIVITRDN